MAILDTTRLPANGHLTQGAFGGFIQSMIGRLVAWAERRETRRALHALSNRELDDIGLTRGDIDSLV